MQDLPKATTLLDAVSQFIDEKIIPEISGRSAFHARVARNVLAIVQREIRFGPAYSRAQKDRLQAILAQGASHDDIETLNQTLCDRLKSGDIHFDDPAIRAHLKKATMGKLSIDQPKYASYRYAQSLGWADEDGYAPEPSEKS